MAIEIKLKAEIRDETGKGPAGRMRRTGWIPAIISCTKGDPLLVKLDAHDFENMLQHHMSEHLLVNIQVQGKRKHYNSLLREVQHHPVSGKVLHADFGEISMTEKMTLLIPLVLKGEPEGVKNSGGLLEQMAREVEVECLPTDLVEEFDVDVSALEIGDSVTMADLVLGDTFAVLSDPALIVASVHEPRVGTDEDEEVEEAAGEGLVEPEVVGRKTDDDES